MVMCNTVECVKALMELELYYCWQIHFSYSLYLPPSSFSKNTIVLRLAKQHQKITTRPKICQPLNKFWEGQQARIAKGYLTTLVAFNPYLTLHGDSSLDSFPSNNVSALSVSYKSSTTPPQWSVTAKSLICVYNPQLEKRLVRFILRVTATKITILLTQVRDTSGGVSA